MSLTDPGIRRALVTGGASGLGRACARRLRDDHHEVITADIAEGADVRLDVTDDAGVMRLRQPAGADRHPAQQRRRHRAQPAAVGDVA